MQFITLFVSICFIAISSADDIYQKRTAAVDYCKKKLSISDADADIINVKQEPSNEDQSCLLECVYEKLGLIKDNKLSPEGAAILSKERFGDNSEAVKTSDAVFKKCDNEHVPSSEKCHLGKHIRKCFISYDNKDNSFFKKN
ncbi:hypothetical protein PGB90_001214 [Kerria lacca]